MSPSQTALIAICGLRLGLAVTACQVSPAVRDRRARGPEGTGLAVDADGVSELFPSAPGSAFLLGNADPNHLDRLEIEGYTRAIRAADGAMGYWNLAAHALQYSSGGTGKTIRLDIHASGRVQNFTWRTQRGYLSTPADLRNQEFTAYVRVHGIFDPSRAAVSLKVRGGAHTSQDGDLASCTMVTFAPARSPGVSRFGKELHHPDYDYVPLPLRFGASLEENRWVGLKLVTYAVPDTPGQVRYELYVDDDPFDARGRPTNRFRRLSEYVDVEGRSTGYYSKLVDWGGFQTTLRVDGVDSLDFAVLSVREIKPPR
jgi:hypothetical protein